MRHAILQAENAMAVGEVPIGAVVVKNGIVISAAQNFREAENQVTAHAEILAIEIACQAVGSWRLEGCDIFVTMEPCPMCAGAIIQARIRNVYFGCYDKKAGAFGSITDLSTLKWTHKPNIYGGILEDKCSILVKDFFLEYEI
jgi:tRNA(adenine34) deaminase